jgi:hypothetical protein
MNLNGRPDLVVEYSIEGYTGGLRNRVVGTHGVGTHLLADAMSDCGAVDVPNGDDWPLNREGRWRSKHHNDGTLARMRTEYAIPLQGKISARIEQLAGDIAAATSGAFRSKLTKERDSLIKQQAELQTFDEKLRHYADLRISLDLDDGVKVNYGKFGDLLAEGKAVTGGRDEE